MKRRLSSRLTKKRNKWIAIIWENESADLTQSEIGELFELKTQQVYSILKEAREVKEVKEAKDKEFMKHLKNHNE